MMKLDTPAVLSIPFLVMKALVVYLEDHYPEIINGTDSATITSMESIHPGIWRAHISFIKIPYKASLGWDNKTNRWHID